MSRTDLEDAGPTPELSDSDLVLVDALADSPRGTWSSIGRRLRISPGIARRRWERLGTRGAAWVTSFPGLQAESVRGVVDLRCRPGTVSRVAEQLRGHPRIMTISAVSGDRDLLVTVIAEDMQEFRRIIHHDLGSLPDAVNMRSSLLIREFTDGSRWRSRGSAAAIEESGFGGAPSRWREVLRLLEVEGRAPTARIAEEMDISAEHARRLVTAATRRGVITQRVDLAFDHSRWPHSLVLWMSVPAAQLFEIGERVASMPTVRYCAAGAGGSSNLYSIFWLRSLSDAADLEAELVRTLSVRVVDRAIVLHYYKRLGWLFDERQRRIGHVSWLSAQAGED